MCDFWMRYLDVGEYFHTLHFIQQMYFLVYSNSSVRGRAQSMKSKSTQICFFSNIAKYYKIFGIWISSQWFTWTGIKIELGSPFWIEKVYDYGRHSHELKYTNTGHISIDQNAELNQNCNIWGESHISYIIVISPIHPLKPSQHLQKFSHWSRNFSVWFSFVLNWT